jgi:hypothetical protein
MIITNYDLIKWLQYKFQNDMISLIHSIMNINDIDYMYKLQILSVFFFLKKINNKIININ